VGSGRFVWKRVVAVFERAEAWMEDSDRACEDRRAIGVYLERMTHHAR
jgi:hypothetical protein